MLAQLHLSLTAVCYSTCCPRTQFLSFTPQNGGAAQSCRRKKAEEGHIFHPGLQGVWVQSCFVLATRLTKSSRCWEQKEGWAAAGGWQPRLVLTILSSLSGAASCVRPREDQFVHSLQATGEETFPFLREKAQQGHDQDRGTAG